MNTDHSSLVVERVEAAFRRCSPSACWSVWDDLERTFAGKILREGLDYPVGHLQRLAAELSVIFGQQKPERLAEVGISDEVIASLQPPTYDVRLIAAAAHPCVYDSDNQPPECPHEWPGEPWKWCGSCLARAVTAE